MGGEEREGKREEKERGPRDAGGWRGEVKARARKGERKKKKEEKRKEREKVERARGEERIKGLKRERGERNFNATN